MNLFRRRQAEPEPTLLAMIADLQAQVTGCLSQVRALESEQITLHDQVRKWMRRAVAAERAVARNQEPDGAPALPVAAPPARRRLWGARARMALRPPVPANVNGSGEADAVPEEE